MSHHWWRTAHPAVSVVAVVVLLFLDPIKAWLVITPSSSSISGRSTTASSNQPTMLYYYHCHRSLIMPRYMRHTFSMMSSAADQVEPTTTTTSPTSTSTTTSPPLNRPKSLSPSSLGDFKTCPRLFRFRHIEKVPEPPSEVMIRGNMVHSALEQVRRQL